MATVLGPRSDGAHEGDDPSRSADLPAPTGPDPSEPATPSEEPEDRPRRGSGWPHSLAGVLGLAVAVWGLLIGIAPLVDNSFLTHLATGRLILDQGIPSADPYSFTAQGHPWVVQSWLASLLYGLADEMWGGTALRLLMGALTMAIGACVWRLTRPAVTLLPRLAIAGVAMGVASEFWSERPLLFGLLFLALLVLAANEEWDPRWAVPMMWVWVNVHGSFPLGLVAVALLALGRRLDGEAPRVELRLLAWASLGTILGVIGPLGLHALTFPIELLREQETLRNITEWKAPTFDTLGQRLFLLQVVAAVLLLVRRPTYRVALPMVVFTAAALLGLRNIPVASLVLVAGMAVGACGLGSLDGARRSLTTGVAAVAVGLLALLVVVAQLGQENFDLDSYPVDAVIWLDDQSLLGTETRLVSRDYVGNYLEAIEGDDVRVFMDDRYDMFPSEISQDYIQLVRGLDPGAVLERHDAGIVLWDREAPFGAWLEEADGWGVVYRDDDWLVACPSAGPGRPGQCAAP